MRDNTTAAGPAILSCLALFASNPAAAAGLDAGLPTDASLAQLIEESLSGLPEVDRAVSLEEAERERIPQAGTLPDPVLQVGIQNDGFERIEVGQMESSFVSIMASQSFLWPGKRDLETKVAQLGADRAAAVTSRVRLSVEAEVRRTYLDLMLVRDRLALLDQLEEIWTKSFGIARARYEGGDGAQSDVLRAQLEQNRIRQRRYALQAEGTRLVQNLNRLRSHALDDEIATPTHVADLPAPSYIGADAALERALARSPERALVLAEVSRAQQSTELARKSYLPDPVVGVGIMARGEEMPPMWLLTVAGPLPVFGGRKQARSIAENGARERAARSDLQLVEDTLRLRSQERQAALLSLQQTIDLYVQGLLVQSKATSESTLSQYKVGRVTFASVLEANAGFVSDQEGYLQAIAAAHRILIADAEVSLLPTSIDSVDGRGGMGMPGAGQMASGGSAETAPSTATGAGRSANKAMSGM